MEDQNREPPGSKDAADAFPTVSSLVDSRKSPDHDSRFLSQLQTDLQPESPGEYSQVLCDSPTSANSDASDDMNDVTPSESPPDALAHFSRLSVDHGGTSSESPVSSLLQTREGNTSLKRSPSSELPREPTNPRLTPSSSKSPFKYLPRQLHSQGRNRVASHASRTLVHQEKVEESKQQSHIPSPLPRDSGYGSVPSSRQQSLQQPNLPPAAPNLPPSSTLDLMHGQTVQRHNGLIQLPLNSRYPGLILQPDSCPISQEQLAAEVKGIYAGLVMVEAKCINMDATQAANPKSPLGSGQWQALIALHRTLLYEHHDFLMATQHPSASEALRGLAAKYSMPARMWKHGIHAFLEVLRHRRPESQEFMLNFIYLAYQMMALLFETVPSFTDTWIECLGDLARYRMAIEEEKEPHGIWGGVAAGWYIMASGRHPAVGRLYHHLAILERPSLRKLCLYAKSLTSVIPFSNARDSLATLCAPIVQDEESIQSSSQSMEPRIVTFFALVYSGRHKSVVERVLADALKLISTQYARLHDNAAYLAYTNIAALFDLGSPTNPLWLLFSHAISLTNNNTRTTGTPPWHMNFQSSQMTVSLSYGIKFCSACFNIIIRHEDDKARLHNSLPFAYVMLVFLHSLFMVRLRLVDCGVPLDTFEHIIEPSGFSWIGLANFLNSVLLHEPAHPQIPESARQGSFPSSSKRHQRLTEDDLIRGSMWCQFFLPGWFDGQTEDEGRAVETPVMKKARAERVLWLGFFLAFHTQYISYDSHTNRFSAVTYTSQPSQSGNEMKVSEFVKSEKVEVEQQMDITGSPEAPSSSSNSEDGFTIVKKSSIPQSYTPAVMSMKQSYPKKRRPDNASVKVVGDDMPWGA